MTKLIPRIRATRAARKPRQPRTQAVCDATGKVVARTWHSHDLVVIELECEEAEALMPPATHKMCRSGPPWSWPIYRRRVAP